MKWALYNLLFGLVYPFLLPGFLVRMLRRGGYRARMGDRFALYPREVLKKLLAADDWVWIHAVSVGEVQVAGQLMREWRQQDPDVRFLFSTTSSTGWKMAEREVTDRDQLIYNPLDFPSWVKSALKVVRPRAIILTESEIWPNFILKARKYGIPLYLINARVSDRSAPRYKAARWFFGDVLSAFTRIFAQSELDKARLVAAGAPVERTEVTGSFKFDVAHRKPEKEEELRAWVGGGRILLGGSTWPGEDQVMISIYKKLDPDKVKLVIAPRHFEKADAIEANIKAAGFRCVRRSRGDRGEGVYLADTTGELMGLYGIADVVFVGKSLCEHGSQNMIEPCLCGKPTLVGPYTENFRPVMSDLLEGQGILQVKDAAELEKRILDLFADAQRAESLGARAAAAVTRRLGVVPKCVKAIRTALCLLLVVLSLAGCSKLDEQVATPTFTGERITLVYLALLEQPMARSVLLAGAHSEAYREFFQRAGLVVNDLDHQEAPYDLVFLAGPTRQTREKLMDKLTPDGVLAEVLDLREETMESLKGRLIGDHLWAPAVEDWLVVSHRDADAKVRLDQMLTLMDNEGGLDDMSYAGITALPDLFASYVGTVASVQPAFANKIEGAPRAQYFVTENVPDINWIDQTGVDADILKKIGEGVRSAQVVRREVLKGNMRADEQQIDAAVAEWRKAYLRNPRDPMLQERLERLLVNGEAFFKVGKWGLSAKCYDTYLNIRPDNLKAMSQLAFCLRTLGKTALAQAVEKRAQQLKDASHGAP